MRIVHNDLAGGLFLLALFACVIIAIEIWTRLRRPDPELSRKAVHFMGGAGSLLFPFVVGSPITVMVIAVVFSGFFFIAKRGNFLHCLGKVTRKSSGSEYYPIAVFLLFYVCQDRLWLYITSILILSVADAAAALIGTRYGRIHYDVGENDKKSLEGSFVFWILTFQAIQIPLLLMTDLPRATCILSALLVSLLLTGIEAISIKGTDNLFVPLLTCFGLLKITTKPVAEIAFQCVSLILMFILLQFVIRKLKLLSIRDSIVFIIFTYACWSLGSVEWSVPVLVCFSILCLLKIVFLRKYHPVIKTTTLIRIIFIPLVILLISNATDLYPYLFGAFILSIIVSSNCGIWLYTANAVFLEKSWKWWHALGFGLIFSFLAVSVSMVFLSSFPSRGVFLVIPIISMSAATIYNIHLQNKPDSNEQEALLSPIIMISTMSVLAYLGAQYSGIVELWDIKG